MKWINAGDIQTWARAKNRHCQQLLPELVRRLILAHTTNALEEFAFPSGDSIAIGGWDGILKTSAMSPFFPSGTSGWEISAEQSARAKAESDYAKRTADPVGLAPSDTHFVFVTARPWPERDKWRKEKSAEGAWKDVRVINAGGLEQWLDASPAVALWLARQIGKVISGGIRDLEVSWDEWSVGTSPAMTPDLVVSGRTRDVEAIQKWISETPRILEAQGDHPDEAIAFLYAAIALLPETSRAQALARCVVVANLDELRQLTQAFKDYPLIIAAPGECVDAAPAAIGQGHHVLIGMDSKVIGIRNVLQLSRPQRTAVETLLHEGGMSKADAEKVARDSGRSIPVLRRRLFTSSAVSAPAWADAKAARILIPALFAGAWDEDREGDRQVVETLSGMSHAEFVDELKPFLSMDDSPTRKIGSVWMMKSQLDAWFLLASHLTNDSLKLFEQSLFAVLTKIDPKYELEAEQRWMAAVYGKSNPCSEWIRTGLVESLVLLAVYGNRTAHIASTQAFANRVVRKALESADTWEAWASISDVTPLLAEAAPEVFIESVEQGVTQSPKIFQELLRDDPGMFGECKHSGLLWALEGLAWSPEYVALAARILGELANLDPGGRWGNRPINSLSGIFVPHFPQTCATPDERLAVLDVLITKYPNIVWKFCQRYIDDRIFSESHRPRWRDTGSIRRSLEPEDQKVDRQYGTGLLPRLSKLAVARENLVISVDGFSRLPTDIREELLEVLEKTDPALFSRNERRELLDGIRQALNWTNSFGDEVRRKQVPSLYRILERFTPGDVVDRVGWLLCTPWPRLPQGEPREYDSRDEVVREAQAKAASELLAEAPMDRILEFANTIEYPGVLGYALGKAVHDDKQDQEVLNAMLKQISKPVLIQAYARRRVEVVGSDWVSTHIGLLKAKGRDRAEAIALLHFGLPEGAATWSAVAAQGNDVEDSYWQYASGHSQADRQKDAPFAVEKLLNAKRPVAALPIAGEPNASIPSPLLQRLLQELLSIPEPIQAGAMEDLYLGHVFKQLYNKGELSVEEIALLEWPFAALFDHLKAYTASPMALHRLLQTDPQFFAQLVALIYKRDDGTLDPSRSNVAQEEVKKRATNARRVLDSWHLVPGLKDGDRFDETELANWVEAARQNCMKTQHVTGGDLQIGLMLSRAPQNEDGVWPHVAIRNLLERLNNQLIERQIAIGIRNKRGVVTRGLTDGGQQERELAAKYRQMSDAVRSRWPRTAALLRSLSESYEHEARYEDIDSELNDLRWG